MTPPPDGQAAPTATPWHLGGITDLATRPRTSIWGPVAPGMQSGEWIAQDITQANAAFIVQAVNSHDALVATIIRGVLGDLYREPTARLVALFATHGQALISMLESCTEGLSRPDGSSLLVRSQVSALLATIKRDAGEPPSGLGTP